MTPNPDVRVKVIEVDEITNLVDAAAGLLSNYKTLTGDRRRDVENLVFELRSRLRERSVDIILIDKPEEVGKVKTCA